MYHGPFLAISATELVKIRVIDSKFRICTQHFSSKVIKVLIFQNVINIIL